MPALPSSNPAQFVQCAPVLHVADVEATAAFYRDVLGFTWDFGDDAYAVVWRDNSAIHFVRDEGSPKGVHLFQWVKDVDAYFKEVVGRGAEVAAEPQTSRMGSANLVCVTSTVSGSCSARISIATKETRLMNAATRRRRTLLLSWVLILSVPAVGRPQPTPIVSLATRAEREAFLSTARFVADAPASGSTAWRASLVDGALKHDATVNSEDGTGPTQRKLQIQSRCLRAGQAVRSPSGPAIGRAVGEQPIGIRHLVA